MASAAGYGRLPPLFLFVRIAKRESVESFRPLRLRLIEVVLQSQVANEVHYILLRDGRFSVVEGRVNLLEVDVQRLAFRCEPIGIAYTRMPMNSSVKCLLSGAATGVAAG